MPRLDPDIAWYYDKGGEAGRLSGRSRLEQARTRHIISRRLPGPPLVIADIGGGPGPYALWLAAMGHAVDLVDPIQLHLDQAAAAAGDAGVTLNGLHHASAEELPFDDRSVDVVLLLGPLYHLPERADRLAALREAYRILKPGGVIFAAVISRYAAALDGFFRDYVTQPDFVAMMRQAARDGQHRNPARRDGLFTTAYFHTVEELVGEMVEGGFRGVETLPIEGVWSCIPDIERKWEEESFRTLLMEMIELTESDPSTVGVGGHIMGVARRPA